MSVGFIFWMILMVILVSLFWVAGRRSRKLYEQVEDVASQALPELGRVAERQHLLRFGRPATDAPGPPGHTSWYPERKKVRAKQA